MCGDLSRGWAALLWQAQQGPLPSLSCWNQAFNLEFPPSALLAPWLRDARGQPWEEELDTMLPTFLFIWFPPDAFQGQAHQ